MMRYTILNDLHFGVGRVAGTTPASRVALKQYLIGQTTDFISAQCADSHLIILGDLFDGFTVDEADMLEVFGVLNHYLNISKGHLFLVVGNHDWSPKGDKVSSFHLLARILSSQTKRVTLIDQGLHPIQDNLYVIPHVPNQDLMDLELERAYREMTCGFLLMHANYDNHFSVMSDHSLNVSEEWAVKFEQKEITLVFAHEHQARQPRPNVVVLGNNWPSSISDCLGNYSKFAWRLS